MSDLVRHTCEKAKDPLAIYQDYRGEWYLELQGADDFDNYFAGAFIAFCPWCGLELPK